MDGADNKMHEQGAIRSLEQGAIRSLTSPYQVDALATQTHPTHPHLQASLPAPWGMLQTHQQAA